MKPELKQAWIEALCSGQYVQGHGVLKRDYSHMRSNKPAEYCCLGVLLDVADKMKIVTVQRWGKESFHSMCTAKVLIEDEVVTLESEFNNFTLKAFGLTRTVANLLIDLNDSRLKNFYEIADWIKENVKEDDNG